jgi:N-methylhydantoinase B
VLDDVLDDYVSVEAARSQYGVVIAGTGFDLQVDERATTELRRRRAAAGPGQPLQ